MSSGPGSVVSDRAAGSLHIAGSAVVLGAARLGEGSLLAQGAVIRSHGAGVEVGTGSAVLENSVLVGNTGIPATIGRRSVFGHRCMVVGAVVGDLCEIGNAAILMPGARVGDRVFLGEGTLVPAGMTLPSESSPWAAPRASSDPPPLTIAGASRHYAAATSPSRHRRQSPSQTPRSEL
jgi:carbonic anhydrase/acetyltransferase-like protein (isoleucine patch superfamily)